MRLFKLWWAVVLCCLLAVVIGCEDQADEGEDAPAAETEQDDDDSGDELYDPGEPGPYAVGNTTRIFTDETRWDILIGGPRQVLTEIWYPVLPEDAVGEYDRPVDMIGKWADLVADILSRILPEEEMQNFYEPLGSIRDAPIAPDGPYPVLLYSHGNAGMRFQAYTMFEHLASHGFIVASPDHPGNAFVTPLPEKLIIYNPLMMVFDFFFRQDDLIFLLNAMDWLNTSDNEDFFNGSIDVENAALAGHSYGGNTVLEVFRRDGRFLACIPFAGPDFPIIDETKEQGLMSFVGMEDHTLPDYIPLHTLIYKMVPEPKALIQITLAGHYTFTNVCDLVPSIMGTGDGCGTGTSIWDGTEFEFIDQEIGWQIINTYVTAWLAWRLKGEDFTPLLSKNLFPEHMDYKVELQ